MKKLAICLLLVRSAAATPAFAQLRLTITAGRHRSHPDRHRAVRARGAGRWRARCGAGDPARSREQRPLQGHGAHRHGVHADHVRPRSTPPGWKQQRNDYVVVGRVSAQPDGQIAHRRRARQRAHRPARAPDRMYRAGGANLRNGAHRIADALYEKIIGVRGAFATRIAYVSVDGKPPSQTLRAVRGRCRRRQPHAYPGVAAAHHVAGLVAGRRMAGVRVVRAARVGGVRAARAQPARRRMVSARAGINGAPSYSPDGKKLALTLSGSNGNLDIYLLELATQPAHAAHRRSRHRHRSGRSRPTAAASISRRTAPAAPQIYRRDARAATNGRKRVTFTGSYNARPRISPDGKQLALLTLDDGVVPHRHPGSRQRQRAGAVEGPPGRISELRAERRDADLRRPRARPGRAADGFGRRPDLGAARRRRG